MSGARGKRNCTAALPFILVPRVHEELLGAWSLNSPRLTAMSFCAFSDHIDACKERVRDVQTILPCRVSEDEAF